MKLSPKTLTFLSTKSKIIYNFIEILLINFKYSYNIVKMKYISRDIEKEIRHTLKRGKSVLLLGARQTGKTTLIEETIDPDICYSFVNPKVRRRYEQSPFLIGDEVEASIQTGELAHQPVVFIDEVQKVPEVLDVVQDLIDRKIATFVLTGSSARKLRRDTNLNLLPGRVILFRLDPLTITEIPTPLPSLETLLLYGSLPGVFIENDDADKETELKSYVNIYLEEEIRAEAMVRNLASFSRFLELAASESGNLINFSKLSQDVGISRYMISEYYQILEDSLIADRIEPITSNRTRHKLSKVPKYLVFDMGIRRLSAGEGIRLPRVIMGKLFEQFIGLELLRASRSILHPFKVRYWREYSGAEIDFIIERDHTYIPVEVKWSEAPTEKDCRHLIKFMAENKSVKQAYIVCRTPRKFIVTKNILAIPWEELSICFS